MAGTSQSYGELLAFLYRAPIALLEIAANGDIKMITPRAAGLLTPLSGDGQCDNLFRILDPVAPVLKQLSAGYAQATGVVCDELHLPVAAGLAGRDAMDLAISILKIEADQLMVLVSDVTERKRSERTLQKAIEDLGIRDAARMAELREKDQILLLQNRQAAMGEMIGNIAHQWRQPLHLLGLTAQQLLLYYDIGNFDRDFLAGNVDGTLKLVSHMAQTIDDFANYFKPDKQAVEFKVQDAIADALSLMKGSFQSPQIKVGIHAEDDPAICGYPNEFSQAFLNMMSNAKDVLTERGIDDPEVRITISSAGAYAVVTVADNAGGIAEEVIDRIFEPYFTTKGGRGGTGVGLFMSKKIIEDSMGGKLSVSNKGAGAEFRIEVPFRAPGAQITPAAP
jgi:signal transduction histidine kinase